MITLIDANIVIAYLRKPDPKIDAQFFSLPAAVCGITRAEMLQGAKGPGDRATTLALFKLLTPISIPETLWDAVGDNLAVLRAVGKPVQFPDVVLATLAMSLDIEVWSRDKHYSMMQILPALKLYQEPP